MTPAELALLGLLAEHPRHGYELEEVIAARGMREWTEIGFSSIYYLLGRLADRGLIAEVADRPAKPTRGKPRKVYSATPAGFQELTTAAEAAIAELRPVFPPLLVGLANLPALPEDRLTAALTTRRHALDERIAAVRAAADRPGLPEPALAVFGYSLGQLTAEQCWLDDYLEGRTVTATTTTTATTIAPYDVKKQLKPQYAPKNTDWELVDVPPMRYLAVDGAGDPNTAPAYAAAVEALYSVAYTLKFAHRDRPFAVGPLEGLWWSADPAAFTARDKSSWSWTMLISLPPWLGDDNVAAAREAALAKKQLPAIAEVRPHTLSEGRSAQLLHTGPYDDEAPKLAHLHDEYFPQHGLDFNGPHHEIYLSDARRVEPAKLRTILRQPVKDLRRT